MPLLDIAISQPCSCFCNNTLAFRQETIFRSNKVVVGNDRGLGLSSAFSWRTLHITKKVGKNLNLGKDEVWRGRLIINSVATLELTSISSKNEGVKNGYQNMLGMDIDSVRSNDELQSSSEDSTEADEREKLRRMRISKANKGNTPWNKGRKHSPETLQKIKERTRLAMQDPKVKMKLVNMGHAQSEDTRVRIGASVRLGWAKRRERLMVQERCHYEWQNLIAESARQGLSGEDVLQWDSYRILSKQFEKEWLQSVEERKNLSRPKGSKRAPKSAEQKRKISEAISAKWADAEYRNRVWSGLAKFHGISERVERKPKRKPRGDEQIPKLSAKKNDKSDNVTKDESKSLTQRVRKRSKAPLYKDPFASSKLEMLKNIRAQRSAPINQKSEAITRAKLLIAEAEKAAKALEVAAQSNPQVHASLIESRSLIAEAIQFLESIKNESFENENYVSENSTDPLPHVEEEEEIYAENETWDIMEHHKVNGFHALSGSDDIINDASSFCGNDLLETEKKHCRIDFVDEVPKGQVKKWFRGRLIEVEEET